MLGATKVSWGGALARIAAAAVLAIVLMQLGAAPGAHAYPGYGREPTDKEKDGIPERLLTDFGRSLKEALAKIRRDAEKAERFRKETEKAAENDKSNKAHEAQRAASDAQREADKLKKEIAKQDLTNEQKQEIIDEVNREVKGAWENAIEAFKAAGIYAPK